MNVATLVKTHEQNTSGQETGVLGLHGDITFQVGINHLAKKLPLGRWAHLNTYKRDG